ncbi:hypothetical protein FH972_026375 [Carpinus fangiana]|uniref:Vps53 N-terminal domain-containing protein n=1 Tax=Carpinus fangiana TaxID=176857 RepID=A0A5N6L454_9ROSI|nr:hypothetical protein FH972_026375 [Carpinus fangiana]
MTQVNGVAPPGSDLDSADYDPITHLNTIFSHPSALSSAPSVSSALHTRQDVLDSSIDRLVSAQAASDASSLARIRAAQDELGVLFSKIDAVRERALATEQAITSMTADIKRLDGTKRNLTLSMTALKRLQMLTTAYEQLRGLVKTRQYKECAQLLQAVLQLMSHFKSYRSIDQIAALGRKVSDLQRELLEQICEDFELAFAKGEVAQKKNMLKEACEVLDALGENARARLVTWYTNTTLREYRQIFRGNDEAGSLDNISRRYAWFNRILKTYDHEHAAIFPPQWRVNEILANSFCEGTRDDFKDVLQKSTKKPDGPSLDVNLLLSCLQETLDFEHSLEKRFGSGEPRASVDTDMSADERPRTFSQAISKAFEPYVSLWVEAQDRQYATLIPKYRQQPLHNADEDFSPQSVIPSSTELFQHYRLNLNQCAKLSTGERLLELSKTFGKYLDHYSQQVLFYFLAERSGPAGPSTEDVVTVLNTADYCYTTCSQLEEKIKARIDSQFRDQVDLESQGDAFLGIAGAAVRALVRKVEADCEPAWREMRNTAWSRLENVGDQSSYVSELVRAIRQRSIEILTLLRHKQQYARSFCDNLVDSLTSTYTAQIALCKPIAEAGAEQMLLDFYVLKKLFADLPSLPASPPSSTPSHASPRPSTDDSPALLPLPAHAAAAYAKRVAATTAKLDPLLKTLQSAAASEGPSRVASPPSAGGGAGVGQQPGPGVGNVNDSLRNIGKFFRRDVAGGMGGAFGRFGGGAGA